MTCISYKYNPIHLIYPEYISSTLCKSYDKTRLCIISFLRLMVYLLFHNYITDLQFSKKVKGYVYIASIILILVNIVLLITYIRKVQQDPKKIENLNH